MSTLVMLGKNGRREARPGKSCETVWFSGMGLAGCHGNAYPHEEASNAGIRKPCRNWRRWIVVERISQMLTNSDAA